MESMRLGRLVELALDILHSRVAKICLWLLRLEALAGPRLLSGATDHLSKRAPMRAPFLVGRLFIYAIHPAECPWGHGKFILYLTCCEGPPKFDIYICENILNLGDVRVLLLTIIVPSPTEKK
jgi:hypothetical protein